MDIVIYDADTEHNRLIKDMCFRFTFQENMECEIHVFEAAGEVRQYMEQSQIKKLVMAGLPVLKENKRTDIFDGHFVVLMGDSPVELMQAVTPGFRPYGLLLKPVAKELLEQLLFEMKEECEVEKKDEEMFFFKIKSQEYLVPKNRILFLESRSKKIVLRTDAQEIEFYDTLDHLSEELGTDFVRVHKSFLVNLSSVSMIHFSNKTVHFPDGTFVPVSRGCKETLEEEWKKRKGQAQA